MDIVKGKIAFGKLFKIKPGESVFVGDFISSEFNPFFEIILESIDASESKKPAFNIKAIQLYPNHIERKYVLSIENTLVYSSGHIIELLKYKENYAQLRVSALKG